MKPSEGGIKLLSPPADKKNNSMVYQLALLLIFGAMVLAAPPAKTTTDVRPVPMITQSHVDRWLATWQTRLKLDHWKVEAKIVRSGDLKPNTLGHIRWDSEKKTALITLLDPQDYDLPATQVADDMEMTVLHELVHLQLSVLPRDKAHKGTEEQVVNRISQALMNLDRQAKPANLMAGRIDD